MPSFVPPGELDLRRTLSAVGVKDWIDGAAWWALSTPSGPATVALEAGNGVVEATGWGSGADEALDRVPQLLGFDDDPKRFEPGDLRELHLRALGFRLGSTGAVFESLVPAILGQVVTTAEARASHRKLVRSLGTPAPGPRTDLLTGYE